MNLNLGDLVLLDKDNGSRRLYFGMIIKINSPIIHIEWMGGKRNLQYFETEVKEFRNNFLQYRKQHEL